jgi:DNA polymerase-3 subunit gamma/tau
MLHTPSTFAGLVELLANNGKPHIAQQLHDFVGVVRYAPPELVIRPAKPLSGDFTRELGAGLKALTGATWTIEVSDESAEPSLLDQEKAQAETLRQQVLESPIVKAAFQAFPDAELTSYNLEEQRSA